MITEDGTANSAGNKILSVGYFLIEVNHGDLQSDSIIVGPHTNLVKTVFVEVTPDDLSVYKNATINITVLGKTIFTIQKTAKR